MRRCERLKDKLSAFFARQAVVWNSKSASVPQSIHLTPQKVKQSIATNISELLFELTETRSLKVALVCEMNNLTLDQSLTFPPRTPFQHSCQVNEFNNVFRKTGFNLRHRNLLQHIKLQG